MDMTKEIRKMMVDHEVNVNELAEELKISRNSVYVQFKNMNVRKYDAMVAAVKRAGERKAAVK